MLLHGLGQSGSNECSHEAHLEIGVTGLVSPKATTQHAMNLVGMPTGSRTKASNTFSKIHEMQRSCAQAVIGHTAEFRHRAAAGQVDDRASHRCHRNPLPRRVLAIEEGQGAMRLGPFEAFAIRAGRRELGRAAFDSREPPEDSRR